MRLSKEDRRSLEKLIKSRMNTKFGYCLKSAPLALIISATIWVSPAALAKVEKQNATIEFQSHNLTQSTENGLDREAFSKPAPAPVKNLEHVLSNQVMAVINGMGKSKNFVKQIKKQQISEPKKSDMFRHAAFGLDYDPRGNSDPIQISSDLGNGGKDVAEKTIENSIEAWQKLKNGFDFKLDFAKLFGGKKKTSKIKKDSGKVRYGLILKDVSPDSNEAGHRAAVDSDLEEELSYAGQAQVEWTIGPVGPGLKNKRPFSSKAARYYDKQQKQQAQLDEQELHADDDDEFYDYQAELEDPVPLESTVQTDADNFWANGGLPSPAFEVNSRPAHDKSIRNAAEGKKAGVKINITQEQGLYDVNVQTPDDKVKKTTAEHGFKLPIIGTLSLGRRYNDTMQVLSTSINNILISKRAPQVSLTYYEKSKQYVSDAKMNAGSFDITFKARSDAKGLAEKERNKKPRKHNENFEVGIKKSF